MLAIDGRPRSACDGMSRRRWLEAAGAGLFGLSLPKLLAAEEALGAASAGRAKSVIFLFLFGGPSQLETFDPKPEAPDTIRGPFRSIATRTPGLIVSEHLPRLAALSDKYAVVRTMSHPFNDHSGAAHYIQTGRIWHIPIGGGFNPTAKDWPSMGSVVEHQLQHAPGGMERDLPGYVVLPNTLGRIQEAGLYLRPGEHAGWLGRRYNPLTTVVDKKDLQDNPYWRDCSDDELNFAIEGLKLDSAMTLDRVGRRVSMLASFDEQRRVLESGRRAESFDRFRQRAVSLVSSEATRRALDVKQEPTITRDRYGRHLFGQSTLVARRLVEAGVRFVTVHYDAPDGYSWDSHVHSDDVKNHLLPTFDQATSALIDDLAARGLLDETLVVAVGEMGRTPTPTARWGRGHWSTLFPALLAGGGVRGGTVLGHSDKNAAYATDRVVTPEQLAATVYHALGIDPDLTLPDPENRPVAVAQGAKPVTELFG